jgi:hypothetical protein
MENEPEQVKFGNAQPPEIDDEAIEIKYGG